MQIEYPLVSVIVPCYNSEKFINQTLDCILQVTYPNWECVIVNDGSTDNSQLVIDEYCRKDNRFRCFIIKNTGPSVARNFAIAQSQGKYILPLDSDDLISPTYISEAVKIHEEDSTIKLVYSKARKFGRKNKKWELPEYSFKDLLIENMIFISAVFRKSDFMKTKGFDPTFNEGREDWEFWIEFLKDGGKVHRIEKEHFFYRIHKNSHNKKGHKNIMNIRKKIYQKHKELYDGIIDNPIQLIHEHAFYKKKYNLLRILTFRKPI